MTASQIMRSTAAMCVLAAYASISCTAIVGNEDTLAPAPPNAPTAIMMVPEIVRAGDTVTVAPSGSVDPGETDVRFRFEWIRSGDVVRTEESDEFDSFEGDFVKADQWRIRITPISADDREGESAELPFVVSNTLPTLRSAALTHYRPTQRTRCALRRSDLRMSMATRRDTPTSGGSERARPLQQSPMNSTWRA